jgi:hypothetical protein
LRIAQLRVAGGDAAAVVAALDELKDEYRRTRTFR